MQDKSILTALAERNGIEAIGASQATIAYTVVADLGGGKVRITAAAHGLKKYQVVYIASGSYAGIQRIINVPDANHVDIQATFVATTTGNLVKTAYLNGYGFFVRKVPLTIAAITMTDPASSSVNVIATPFNVGDIFYGEFESIRLSAGDVDVVRGPLRAQLTYTNR